MAKRQKVNIIAGAIVIIGVGALLSFYLHQRHNNVKQFIKVSGNIEATEVRLSFRVGGKIKELLCKEGSMVKVNDVVARLDTDELLKVKVNAEASLKLAQFTAQQAHNDYLRAENLFQAGAVSAQKRDTAKTNADTAASNVAALNASLELAETRLGFAELTSSINGFILVKSAEIGEVVQAGNPVFTVIDLNDVWLTAYISETDLGRVKLNQEVDIKIDTYPDKLYKGHISFIAQEAEFTPKQIQTTEERVKLVYRIKIILNNINDELKPGMPADGLIIVW